MAQRQAVARLSLGHCLSAIAYSSIYARTDAQQSLQRLKMTLQMREDSYACKTCGRCQLADGVKQHHMQERRQNEAQGECEDVAACDLTAVG